MQVSKSILITVGVLAATVVGGVSKANADTWRARTVTEVKQSINQVGFNNYVIQRGDTLWAISQATGVSIQQLQAIYHTDNPNLIIAGTHLVFNGDHMTVVTEGGQNTGTYTVTPAPQQATTNATAVQQNSYALKSSATTQVAPSQPQTQAQTAQSSNQATVAQQPAQTSAAQTAQSTGAVAPTTPAINTAANNAVAQPAQNNGNATAGQQPQEQVAYSVNYYLLGTKGAGNAGGIGLAKEFHETKQVTNGQQVTVQPKTDGGQYAYNYPGEPFSISASDGPSGRIGVYGQVDNIPDKNLQTPDITPADPELASDLNQTFKADNSGQQVNFYYQLNTGA